MSEDDLREIGISTLGSRRKLQMAISGEYFLSVRKLSSASQTFSTVDAAGQLVNAMHV